MKRDFFILAISCSVASVVISAAMDTATATGGWVSSSSLLSSSSYLFSQVGFDLANARGNIPSQTLPTVVAVEAESAGFNFCVIWNASCTHAL
jgi:hypothetical protein